ncbi:MAG: peptidoglycan DD-metalloendopeptidase family protein [Pseudomonadota bacterium]
MCRILALFLLLSGCGKTYHYIVPIDDRSIGQKKIIVTQANPSKPTTKISKSTTQSPKKHDVVIQWPIKGAVLSKKRQNFDKGIELRAKPTDYVVAVADGVVLFSGHGGRHIGNIIVIKHAKDVLSLYTQQQKNLVMEGQTVKSGQHIALLGKNEAGHGHLHFELRVNALPVNPLHFLPKRSNHSVDN